MDDKTFKIRLISVADETERVTFDVTPTFSESRSVDYSPVAPIHMPGSIQVYKGTAARTFSIGAPLISRTPGEAFDNMRRLQLLRSWTLPYFGQSTVAASTTGDVRTTQQNKAIADDKASGPQSQDQTNKVGLAQVAASGYEFLGAPPMILYLYAYSSSSNDTRGEGKVNINRLPVAITNLEISYPNDVDYISTSTEPNRNTEPFPVKMEITVSLVETHSPREYERFSLSDFKSGKLVNF